MTFQGQAVSKALETLRAIEKHFDEGAQQVYAGALLFEDESTVRDHVESARLALEEAFLTFSNWKDVPCPYCVKRIGVVSATCEDCMGRGLIRRITGQ